MHKERLEQMVTMLRGLPPEKFDISDWHCGTTACAVGHACVSPVFNEQGLELSVWDGPKFGEFDGWSAVREFFELNTVDANYLFDMDKYIQGPLTLAGDVADRIEAFIAA
jgi:hypothetical protein